MTDLTTSATDNTASQGDGALHLLTAFCNHSGGAKGGDTEWDLIGRRFGFCRHVHYREPGQHEVDSIELRRSGVKATPISQEDYEEGQRKATEAARQMGRIEPTHQVRDKYVLRNWAQVKYSAGIYAIAHLVLVGEDLKYGRKAKCTQVAGGTGYAVHMAILEGKPVHVFDQKRGGWYTFDADRQKWVREATPILCRDYAGIGSRDLKANGVAAIEAVYAITLQKLRAGEIS